MSLREKLEKVHSLLINEDKDEATILFHEAFVEAAREVHNTIMEEEDWLEEEFDSEVAENEDEIETQENESSEFGGNVLGEEGEDEEGADEFGGEEEVGVEDEAEFGDAEDEAGADIEGELDADGEEEGASEIIADLEDDLARLKAEFETLGLDDEAGEDEIEVDGDEEGDMDMDMDAESEAGEGDEFEGNEVYADESVSVRVKEGEEVDEDDEALEEVDELDESFELENVEANNTHDHIGSGGEKLSSNDKSVLPKKRGDARDGDAVKVKSKNHNGYNKETPPTTAQQEKRKNVRSKAAEDQSPVSKEGDSSAILNKDHSDGYGAENVKSPIGSKGSKTTKGLTEGKAKAKATRKRAPRKTK